jgi:hypothetical protein
LQNYYTMPKSRLSHWMECGKSLLINSDSECITNDDEEDNKGKSQRHRKLRRKIVKLNTILASIQNALTSGCDAKEQVISTIPSGGYVITQPGKYCLQSNQLWSPSSSGLAAITVAANNVYLDLNHYTITQSADQTAINGITITGNNIIVANGTLRNISQYGILVNAGSYSLGFENVKVLETGVSSVNGAITSGDAIALLFLGSALTSRSTAITDVVITNSDFSFGQTTAVNSINPSLQSPLAGIYFRAVNTAAMTSVQANALVGPNVVRMAGFLHDGSQNLSFFNAVSNLSTAQNVVHGFLNTGGITRGILYQNCESSFLTVTGPGGHAHGFGGNPMSDVTIVDCLSRGNVFNSPTANLGSGAVGLCIIATNNLVIDNFHSSGHTSNGDHAHGMHVLGCNNVVFRNCVAENLTNTVGEARGFTTFRSDRAATEGCTNVQWIDCIAKNITGTSSTAGFQFNNGQAEYAIRCISENIAGDGFLVSTTTPAVTIRNVEVSQSRSDFNTGHGFNQTAIQQPTGPNRYYKNIAQNNTAGNYNIPPGNPIAIWNLSAGALPIPVVGELDNYSVT